MPSWLPFHQTFYSHHELWNPAPARRNIRMYPFRSFQCYSFTHTHVCSSWKIIWFWIQPMCHSSSYLHPWLFPYPHYAKSYKKLRSDVNNIFTHTSLPPSNDSFTKALSQNVIYFSRIKHQDKTCQPSNKKPLAELTDMRHEYTEVKVSMSVASWQRPVPLYQHHHRWKIPTTMTASTAKVM